MSLIYCNFDMFTYNQAIRIINEDGSNSVIYCSINDVADTIAHLCKEKNITNIRLYGDKTYLNTVVDNIQTKYNLNYHSGKPLSIEVN